MLALGQQSKDLGFITQVVVLLVAQYGSHVGSKVAVMTLLQGCTKGLKNVKYASNPANYKDGQGVKFPKKGTREYIFVGAALSEMLLNKSRHDNDAYIRDIFGALFAPGTPSRAYVTQSGDYATVMMAQFEADDPASDAVKPVISAYSNAVAHRFWDWNKMNAVPNRHVDNLLVVTSNHRSNQHVASSVHMEDDGPLTVRRTLMTLWRRIRKGKWWMLIDEHGVQDTTNDNPAGGYYMTKELVDIEVEHRVFIDAFIPLHKLLLTAKTQADVTAALHMEGEAGATAKDPTVKGKPDDDAVTATPPIEANDGNKAGKPEGGHGG
jgi:hypothetical protein